MDVGEVLRICSDPDALNGLRGFLMGGVAISVGVLMIDAWKRGVGQALPRKTEDDPICPLHRVVRSKCDSQHGEPPAEPDPED